MKYEESRSSGPVSAFSLLSSFFFHPSPFILIWNDLCQRIKSNIFQFIFYILFYKEALVQAASTMLQSDIRRLAFLQRPELTGICFVKNWAFFGREYRGLPLLT
ncbi:MAG: hypothetical protein ISS70_14620 [Phycisphaerae bacterium]|nr:hypothetical protein [Phycisphaerae bacterium]